MAKGQTQTHYSEDQRDSIFERVCELYETEHCSIESACNACNIHKGTFYLWANKDERLQQRYIKAKENQEAFYWEELIKPLAKTALERLLTGETKTEQKRDPLAKDGFLTGHERIIVTETEMMPNPTVTIFSMKGLYPGRFTDRHDVTSGGKEIQSPLLSLPIEKQAEILRLLKDGGDT